MRCTRGELGFCPSADRPGPDDVNNGLCSCLLLVRRKVLGNCALDIHDNLFQSRETVLGDGIRVLRYLRNCKKPMREVGPIPE